MDCQYFGIMSNSKMRTTRLLFDKYISDYWYQFAAAIRHNFVPCELVRANDGLELERW